MEVRHSPYAALSLLGFSVEQAARRNTERLCQSLDYCEAGIAIAPLDIAYIGTVDLSSISIILLAPTLAFTKAAYVLSKAHTNIHASSMRGLSAIGLQTISDITT